MPCHTVQHPAIPSWHTRILHRTAKAFARICEYWIVYSNDPEFSQNLYFLCKSSAARSRVLNEAIWIFSHACMSTIPHFQLISRFAVYTFICLWSCYCDKIVHIFSWILNLLSFTSTIPYFLRKAIYRENIKSPAFLHIHRCRAKMNPAMMMMMMMTMMQ